MNEATKSGNFTTYQLHIDVDAAVKITVGALGLCEFPAGRYVYTGSALRNIDARIRRHYAKEKRHHWHIDYLLDAPGVRIAETQKSRTSECQLNAATPGEALISGFGASDCRAACNSHLKYQGIIN